MSMHKERKTARPHVSRRDFIKVTTMAAAVGAVPGFAGDNQSNPAKQPKKDSIVRYRTLGRTGFKVSDIGMGCIRVRESNVVRYAYDKGINYFDTAEGYGNGDSERIIGQAMPHMEREKIFVTTKLHFDESESKENILKRFEESRKRLQTNYVDCLYMHSVTRLSMLNHQGFHAAVKQLKAEGKLRFAGLSSHGPRSQDEDSMEKVLTAAAEDGRFDLMLLVYNYLNREAGEKILEACRKNNVGTTAMKITPGYVKVEKFDPENPTAEQKRMLDRFQQRGMDPQKAEKRLKEILQNRREELAGYEPFFKKYGIDSEEALQQATIQWVLKNADMHTICYTFTDFDQLDKLVPLSGTELSMRDQKTLDKYARALSPYYCRHGCDQCISACENNLPVSSIMRYAYYFACHGREKMAVEKYARLHKDARLCMDCSAPCLQACPHELNVQANLLKANELLTMA